MHKVKEIIACNRSLQYNKSHFVKWAYFEKEILLKHKYISIQSEWVKSQIAPFINKDASILRSRMAIRKDFFNGQWKGISSRCIITVSAGPTCYKGVHDIIKALPIILENYPETKLKIIGNFGHDAPIWRRSGYTKFLQDLIKDYGLEDKVIFTGHLNAKEIVNEMEDAGAMVISSYVESYSLAMAEAMAVGLLCVATYAGALPELAVDGESALYYCPGDYEVLAAKICSIFADENFSSKLSHNSRKTAIERNNDEAVFQTQLNIYNYVLGNISD